jgi:ribosomal protein S6--L-glutamate ligase
MKRQSAADWRTNVSRGGIPSAVELSRHEAELASSAAEAVGCAVAGVDLLPGPAGERYVIEVNASPGWQALAPTSGIDVAQAIVRFATEGFSHWRNATR